MNDEKTFNKEAYEALLELQSSVGAITKTGSNPIYKSKYATLGDILKIVKPKLKDHGFALHQPTYESPQGNTIVRTDLTHLNTGEHFISDIKCNVKKIVVTTEGDKKDQYGNVKHITQVEDTSQDPQKNGAAITYARRYGLLGLLNIEEEDDDGNSASGKGGSYASNN